MSGFDSLFSEALAGARHTAWHWELRDSYALADIHRDSFATYSGGPEVDAAFMEGWATTVREAVARGVEFRRLRVVSEPVSDYIRWEHALTAANVSAGEHVRWLSRRTCPPVALPVFDGWLFDSSTLLANHFAGDGSWPEPSAELLTGPDLVKLVADSFEAVWSLAVPHNRYIPA